MRASAADHSWAVDQVTKVDNAYYDNYKCSVCDHVKVEPHTHSWSYSAADNVLTATCAEGKCPLHSGVRLTVKAEDGEYNKNPHAAAFGSREDEVWIAAGLTLPRIQYRNPNNDLLSQAPRNVGTYTAFIQVGDVKAGSAYTITPKGLTSDNYEITFHAGKLTVSPKSLRNVSVALEKTAYAPTGSAIAPSVTAADGDRALVPDRDFTVGYDNNNPTATPATAVVTITGTGNYKDSVTLKFVITDALTRIPALPQSGEPDDLDTIDAYEAAKAALDAMDEEQKALLGNLAGELEKRLDTLLDALTDYRIIRGEGSRWSQNSDRSLSFTANGALRKFTHLQVDGITLADHQCILKSGSTIVTLSKDFLSTLKVGTHILQIFYSDGQTNVVSFRTHPPAANPITGDTSPVLLLGGVFTIALVGVVTAHCPVFQWRHDSLGTQIHCDFDTGVTGGSSCENAANDWSRIFVCQKKTVWHYAAEEYPWMGCVIFS